MNFSTGSTSSRRLLVWTDLTGTPSTTMASNTNLNNGNVIRTNPRINTGDMSANVTLPRSMLYNAGTGQSATAIYVLATTDSTNFVQPTATDNGTMRKDTPLISSITLSVTGMPVYSARKSLVIDDADAEQGWVSLLNISDSDISTKGLYLSDGDDSNSYDYFFLWQMPSAVVKSGESVLINTSENDTGLKRLQTGFNLKSGGSLRLVDADGEILSLFKVG